MAMQHSREGPSFELVGFRHEYGRIVVEGRWSGVRGLRFVRPTLIIGGRELLATLDHKPWAPEARLWRAAFRWDEPEPRAEDAALAVAPSVVVPLVAGAGVPRTLPREVSRTNGPGTPLSALRAPATSPRAPARGGSATTAAPAPAPPASTSGAPTGEDASSRRVEQERDAALARAREAQEASALVRGDLDAASARARDERSALADAEHEHVRALRTLRAEHSRALEEREGDLARLREQHAAEADTAQRVRDAARTARERAAELEASREAALTARRQRDDALVAHRALQRRVDGLLATESATDPAPATTGHVAAAPDDGEPAADPETPIGIRALPSAAGLAPGLHRAERPVRASPSRLDLWAIRTVGAITAGCFLLLLLLLLRVFL